jgi:iron complex outermembrane recepter protein
MPNAQEPGYLSAAEAQDTPRLSNPISATDGGEREMNALSVHADANPGNELSWSAKAYGNQLRDTRYVRFSDSVPQQERVTNENQYGVLATLSWRPTVARVHGFALEGGFNAHREDNASLRYLSTGRTRQSQTRDQTFGFETQGAYLQAVIQPTDAIKIVPAYRVDHVGGSFTNHLKGVTSPINGYGLIRQPKFSWVVSPWQQASLYGNWGRSFQVGAGSAAYKIPPSTAELKPSINDGWELGLKFQPAPGVDGRVAYWEQRASDEVRRKLNDPAGDSENVGKTLRKGYDLQVNLRPERRVNVWLASSRQMSEILEPDPNAAETRGKEIDHVPHHVASGGIDFQALPALRLWVSAHAQSSYFLERANVRGKFGRYVLLDLGSSYQLSSALSVDLQIKNATDRHTEYVWWDGAKDLHSPGDARAGYASLNWRFDQ